MPTTYRISFKSSNLISSKRSLLFCQCPPLSPKDFPGWYCSNNRVWSWGEMAVPDIPRGNTRDKKKNGLCHKMERRTRMNAEEGMDPENMRRRWGSQHSLEEIFLCLISEKKQTVWGRCPHTVRSRQRQRLGVWNIFACVCFRARPRRKKGTPRSAPYCLFPVLRC